MVPLQYTIFKLIYLEIYCIGTNNSYVLAAEPLCCKYEWSKYWISLSRSTFVYNFFPLFYTLSLHILSLIRRPSSPPKAR